MNVIERIADSLQRRPALPAIEFGGRWYDWRTLAEAADQVLAPLAGIGVTAGMTVALVARNRPGHVAALLGLLARRIRVRMVYAFQPATQLADELRGIAVAGVVLDEEDAGPEVRQALRATGALGVAVDGALDHAPEVFAGRARLLPDPVEDGIAIEMLTSGTTGAPKRIAIATDTLDRATADLIRAGAAATAPDIVSFPIGNISGLYYLVPACANATPLVLLEKFGLDAWLQAVQRHRPPYCAVPPAGIRMLLDAEVPAQALAGLTAIGVGAAPLPTQTQVAFEQRYGLPILIGYGATEFCGVVAAWTLEDHQRHAAGKRGSVGRARPGVILRIVDADTGAPLPTGEVGVIEAQVERIGPGFVRTTDLGLLDEDGFLFLQGRADDVINRGGFKVQPQKVEALLRENAAVAEAAVVAVHDERLGDVPVAVIELRSGAAEPPRAELDALLRKHLRPPEVPAGYLFVPALPRTPSMKVRRVEVRALVDAARSRGGLEGSNAPMKETRIPVSAVRKDFVPKDSYLSREFARLEQERLWPRVWQVTCRVEEIPRVGDYVAYDIGDESVIVVRTAADRIQAFYNACQHRGRRLVDGCGNRARFVCKFHGWSWHVDGRLAKATDHEDWEGCPEMAAEDLALPQVKVDTWQGFVFVNFDPDCEPLAQFLAPVPAFCDGFEFGKMRFWWYKSVKLPCNWKVALEAFNEGYHVSATHPQLLDTIGDDRTKSFAHGRHGMFGYYDTTRPVGAPSPRTGKPMPQDLRPGMVGYLDELGRTLRAVTTWRDNEATKRLLTDASASDDAITLMVKMQQFHKEAAEKDGAGWPAISFEDQYKAGTDWHVFPNMIFLPYPDGALFYRARPDGNDPDRCIYDIWSLARFAPGKEPPLEREFYWGPDDWQTDMEQRFGKILAQDFENMSQVQRGMKSAGFKGSRTSPRQEVALSNFHRVLHEMLGTNAQGGGDEGRKT